LIKPIDILQEKDVYHDLKMDVFTIMLTGLLLAKPYELSIRQQKACRRMCTTGFSANLFI